MVCITTGGMPKAGAKVETILMPVGSGQVSPKQRRVLLAIGVKTLKQTPQPEALRNSADASTSDRFAWLRTRLAVERSFLAWTRTSVALIACGFAIVQFFQQMNGLAAVQPALLPEAPQDLGQTMIVIGVAILAVNIADYRKTIGYLHSGEFAQIAGAGGAGRPSLIYALLIALCCVGVFCFLAFLR